MRISRFTRNRFMHVFVSVVRCKDSNSIHPNAPELSKLKQRSDYANVIGLLISMELIKANRRQDGKLLWYELTNSGMCYFERRANERRKLILNSVAVPIIVSIITTAVTVYILPPLGERLKRWLAGTPEQIQQFEPKLQPTCDLSGNPEMHLESPVPLP